MSGDRMTLIGACSLGWVTIAAHNGITSAISG
jgi:hypothetical protein